MYHHAYLEHFVGQHFVRDDPRLVRVSAMSHGSSSAPKEAGSRFRVYTSVGREVHDLGCGVREGALPKRQSVFVSAFLKFGSASHFVLEASLTLG